MARIPVTLAAAIRGRYPFSISSEISRAKAHGGARHNHEFSRCASLRGVLESFPMKHQFVELLQEGDSVDDYFLATRKDVRTTANGNKFLGMVFRDRTGDIGGIHWTNPVGIASNYEVGDVVQVRGRVQTYQERLQLKVDTVVALREGEFDEADLVDEPIDIESVLEAFTKLMGSIKEPHLAKLVDTFWGDMEFRETFVTASAGKRWHHGYRGGLIEHCLEMGRLVDNVCAVYTDLNRDVMMAAVLLHDVGKLEELSQDMAVEYTDAGRLVGHIVIGVQMTQERIAQIEDFPEATRLHLLHIILSHHSLLENGSPVVPKTREAMIFGHIDDMSAQMNAWGRVMDETRKRGDDWSEYLPLIQRQLWSR